MGFSASRVRAFNAVYQCGSFSEAARRLGLSQPAISQQIREMEAEFDVALFERRGQHLHPTALCHQVYSSTLRLQACEAEALRQHDSLKDGELRVGMGNSMPGMALVAEFIRAFGRIQLHVEMGSWTDILNAVVEQRVDVGILPDVPDEARFRRQICLHQSVIALAAPSHPLAGAGTMSCRELADQRLIFRTKRSSTQRVVDRAFKSIGLEPRPAMILDTRDGVLEAVAHGLGIGFMWEHGSSLTGAIAKLRVTEMADQAAEHIFCLAGKKDRLVDLFFQTRLPNAAG